MRLAEILALFREAVDVGSLVEVAAGAPEVGVSEIVGEDEDDIRLAGCVGCDDRGCQDDGGQDDGKWRNH